VKYHKYATIAVGAHSAPGWYEALDRLVAVWQPSMASMADAQYHATPAAVLDQEIAAIDVVTGGEMHRANPQPALSAERHAELLLAEDSCVPGRDTTAADHQARP
jgi:hypothetical protein